MGLGLGRCMLWWVGEWAGVDAPCIIWDGRLTIDQIDNICGLTMLQRNCTAESERQG